MRGLFSSNNEYDHQSYVTAFKALLFKLSGIKLLPMTKHIDVSIQIDLSTLHRGGEGQNV